MVTASEHWSPDPILSCRLASIREEDTEAALQAIIRAVKSRIERNELASNVVDIDTISSVVADLSSRDEDLADSSAQTQSAFLRPRLYFDPVRNTLLL